MNKRLNQRPQNPDEPVGRPVGGSALGNGFWFGLGKAWLTWVSLWVNKLMLDWHPNTVQSHKHHDLPWCTKSYKIGEFRDDCANIEENITYYASFATNSATIVK